MKKKNLLILLLLALAFAFFYFDFHSYLSLAYIKSQQSYFSLFYNQHSLIFIVGFSFIYITATALSFPGATVLTLLAGAIFGLFWGTVIVSFASTIGATVAFLGSRYFFRDRVARRFAKYLKPFNEGQNKNGAFYLFTLRLTPVVPFFVINLVMGLTQMSTVLFYIISQIGMLPGTILYVNAGTQLAQIEKLQDILSPTIFLSLLALGFAPLLFKKMGDFFKAKKVYHGYKKPNSFDYNLLVLGGGAAGLVSSYIAAAAKAKIALIEKHKMGGDCLNTGCVPSKSLIRSAKFFADIEKAKTLGVQSISVDYKFADVMERVQRVVQSIAPHDSVERYTQLGVDCLSGEGKLLDPWTIEVNGQKKTAKNIIIATGARPFIPEIPGIHNVHPLTSDTLWELRELPQRLLVLGGGPIGLELAQSFQRFGSQVTLLEQASTLLAREDKEVSQWINNKLTQEGVQLLLGAKARAFTSQQEQFSCEYETSDGTSHTIIFDKLLVAVGRAPNVSGFGLEDLGIELTEKKGIRVNEKLQTNIPNILACGDVTSMHQFTHMASYQAWFASMNALLSPFWSFKASYDIVPWCMYTDPEVARVGLNENEATAAGLPFRTTFYNIDHLDRALTEETAYGFVKVITEGTTDKILGATIVGPHAGECIAEFVLAIKHGLGLNKILQTIHIYPTLTEANKFAAGEWRRGTLSEKMLNLSKSFNNWRIS
ncbi:MAG: FAD-dependent oxidoreductase [Bdellovibrionaceae bacterium]|nr:FAD-dependent oxidoreductase [Pseudobdellovibrionaceae bacterium]